jgi:hypothetical protein
MKKVYVTIGALSRRSFSVTLIFFCLLSVCGIGIGFYEMLLVSSGSPERLAVIQTELAELKALGLRVRQTVRHRSQALEDKLDRAPFDTFVAKLHRSALQYNITVLDTLREEAFSYRGLDVLNLTAAGEYPNLRRFLQAVVESNRGYCVNSFSLVKTSMSPTLLEMRLSVGAEAPL